MASMEWNVLRGLFPFGSIEKLYTYYAWATSSAMKNESHTLLLDQRTENVGFC